MNNTTIDLIAASNHPYTCTCEQCKSWWAQVGPDEDGKYGPFNKEEVQSETEKLTHSYNHNDPSEPCPYCNEQCEADFVDVGIGMVQCGPYHCESCGASEIGPEGSEGRSEIEKKTGWYKGGGVSPYANTINGVIVDHRTAGEAYRYGILDDPLENIDDLI